MNREMMRALEADGEKLRQLTGEDHGPWELTAPVNLQCSIANVFPGVSSPNFCYVVTDADGIVVAEGISSSPDWVRHDAGGYHTKEKFDKLFPRGWTVHFNF